MSVGLMLGMIINSRLQGLSAALMTEDLRGWRNMGQRHR